LVKSDVRIAFKHGRWYLIIPYEEEAEPKANTTRVLSLDPGARSQFTYFDPQTREWGELGKQQHTRPVMSKCNKKRDELREAIDKAPAGKKAKLRKAWYRILARTSNLMTDLHYKTIIAWMLNNYDVIISPKFSTAGMLQKSTSVLEKSTRELFTFLSHYKFRERLLYKAKFSGKMVLDCDESYTTMCCSSCGYLKKDVGRSEVYHCNRCGLKLGRDQNSAKDIFLKCFWGRKLR
jgi:putative transposase